MVSTFFDLKGTFKKRLTLNVSAFLPKFTDLAGGISNLLYFVKL